MNQYIPFHMDIAKEKPNTHQERKITCPFCDRETLRKENGVISEQGEFLLVKNKYPIYKNAFATVLIETDTCDKNISNYKKEHMDGLIRFAIENWMKIKEEGKYKSVHLFKNHGPFSGGSIHHAHMQIIGYEHLDYEKGIEKSDFEGIPIFKNEKVEMNISTLPKSEAYEFNIMIPSINDCDEMARCIQVAVAYILEILNQEYSSYNLAFYEFHGRIICKIISRVPTTPLFIGYRMIPLPDNLNEVATDMQKRFFNKK